jgi:hypothetical protein
VDAPEAGSLLFVANILGEWRKNVPFGTRLWLAAVGPMNLQDSENSFFYVISFPVACSATG